MRKKKIVCSVILVINLTKLFADVPLKEILNQTGATFYWEGTVGRGCLVKNDARVVFVLDNKEILLGQRLAYGQVTLNKNQIFFDDDIAQRLIAYLGPLHKVPLVDHAKAHQVAVILIDPGHGGRDSGAIGQYGNLVVREKDICLSIGLELERLLKKKYPGKQILMTRKTDTYPSLEERVEIANKQKLGPGQAEIYISIHANATPRTPHKAQGFEVWYLPDTVERDVLSKTKIKNDNLRMALGKVIQEEFLAESRQLANFLLNALKKGIGHITNNRGIRRESWFVVRNAQMAAVLVEVGFVTHPEEAKRLNDPKHLKTLAGLLYNGLMDFVEYFEQQ